MLGCGGAGAIAGIVYLAIRPVVAPGRRAPVAALAAGTFGPAVIIDPDGVDFALLEPALLAVAMFVASMAAFGYTVSVAAWAGQIGVVAAIGLSAAFLAVDVAAVV